MTPDTTTDHIESPDGPSETPDSKGESAVETARRQLQHAAEHLDIDPNVVALSRVAEAKEARGLWP